MPSQRIVFFFTIIYPIRSVSYSIASSLQLKSGSKNTPDGGRYLTISKKIPPNVMAKDILNGGIYAQQFELVAPTNGRR